MQRLEWHCDTKSVSGALYKAISYHGQSAGKEMANSAVFNFRRNAGSDWISLTEVGSKFQARDAAARNARSPMVARRVGGPTSVDVEADWRRGQRKAVKTMPEHRLEWISLNNTYMTIFSRMLTTACCWVVDLNNFIRRETVEVQYEQTAIQTIQLHTKKACMAK